MPSPNFDSVIDTFTVEDLFFLRYQYRVYKDWNNDPRLAVLPGANPAVIGAKPTSGIRFVDGTDQLRYQVGGGLTPIAAPYPTSTTDPKYLAGATGTLFRRLTTPSFAPQTSGGGFTISFQTGAVSYNSAYVLDYSVRGYSNPNNPYIFDASPRLISNLVVDQTGKTPLQVLDNPYALEWTQAGTKLGKRVSQKNNTRHETILTGGDTTPNSGNPLPNSGFFALFGQYNDHGLDFVDKGKDGTLLIPLLPGDSLYTPGSPTNFMALSRTNTVQVEIGEGSRDVLVSELGLAGYSRPTQWDVDQENAAVGTSFNGTTGGTLVLNDQLIQIAQGASLADVVASINTKAAFTGVVASITSNASNQSVLKLTPRNGESVNNTSAFLDLNQIYGSVESHAIFMREYKGNGELTGRLLDDPQKSTARWFDLKKNAQRIGLTLRDRDVKSVPLVEKIPQGLPNAGRYAFVVLDKVSGQKSYIFDTAAIAANQVLAKAGSAFILDLAPDWKGAPQPAGVDPFLANGDLKDPSRLNQHAVGGDGRLNENIGLTSIHEIFVTTHNNILAQIQANLAQNAGNNGNNQPLTGEELFQMAKLANENFYQHHVLQEYARRITPNLGAFAGPALAANNNNAGFNASILAEFAHSAFRFGHSQLTETVALQSVNQQTGLANPGGKQDIPLLQAFLAPQLYTRYTAGEIAAGMSQQVGNATDEYVTNTLRNALVGLPLDLAALNIGRGLDAGITPLNEARRQIQAFLRKVRETTGGSALGQANNGIDSNLAALEANLRPYTSWADFGAHLLHPDSLKGFIMAYARDAILRDFSANSDLTYWNNLQASTAPGAAAQYATALSNAANAAMASPSFMGSPYAGGVAEALNPSAPANNASGNKDFEKISLWLGGLAEAKTPGGMLGPTHDFIYAYQMQQLQRGDEAYYLSKLAATDLVEEIKGKTVADMVMAATGVKHLYHKIFAVNDADYERSLQSFATFANETALFAASQSVVDATGVSRQVGMAGYVNGVLTGNAGNYLDARGVFSPNGVGKASEMFGGTSGQDKFKGLGGDDCMWGDAGDDIMEGGDDNDFADGGEGNDSIYGGNGFDMLRGDDGNDQIYGGVGNDDMYGGEGADSLFGEDGADDLNGGNGNDLVSGGLGADLVKGQAGNDTLIGGQGADVLTGGGGNDAFVFNEALLLTGVDQIRDFNSGRDKLVFDKIIYSGLVGTTLSASQFLATVGQPTATTASQRFLYNLSTGDLFFDPDGSGATTATQVANLNRFNPAFPSDTTSANALVPTLLAGDFILV